MANFRYVVNFRFLTLIAFKHKFLDIHTEQLLVSKFNEQEANLEKIWQKWLPVVET